MLLFQQLKMLKLKHRKIRKMIALLVFFLSFQFNLIFFFKKKLREMAGIQMLVSMIPEFETHIQIVSKFIVKFNF